MTFRWRRTRPTRHGITARRRIGIELLLSPSGAGRRARFVLKEAAVYGDDPTPAFSVTPPETVRPPNQADRDGGFAVWESTIKPALAIVGPAADARKMGLAPRTARAWASGERQPEKAGKVARAIVAVAREAGLGFESAEHLRAEQICAELPGRAAAVQCFASLAVAMLTEHHDGIQALACAMAGEVDTDLEPIVRRWSLWQGSSSVESVT